MNIMATKADDGITAKRPAAGSFVKAFIGDSLTISVTDE